ncbi:hypothetical protein ScPMuIL_010762 [Solemya velum]
MIQEDSTSYSFKYAAPLWHLDGLRIREPRVRSTGKRDTLYILVYLHRLADPTRDERLLDRDQSKLRCPHRCPTPVHVSDVPKMRVTMGYGRASNTELVALKSESGQTSILLETQVIGTHFAVRSLTWLLRKRHRRIWVECQTRNGHRKRARSRRYFVNISQFIKAILKLNQLFDQFRGQLENVPDDYFEYMTSYMEYYNAHILGWFLNETSVLTEQDMRDMMLDSLQKIIGGFRNSSNEAGIPGMSGFPFPELLDVLSKYPGFFKLGDRTLELLGSQIKEFINHEHGSVDKHTFLEMLGHFLNATLDDEGLTGEYRLMGDMYEISDCISKVHMYVGPVMASMLSAILFGGESGNYTGGNWTDHGPPGGDYSDYADENPDDNLIQILLVVGIMMVVWIQHGWTTGRKLLVSVGVV